MAATLLAVNERAHVDLSDDDIGAEPAVLGATDCSFFAGPKGSTSRLRPAWSAAGPFRRGCAPCSVSICWTIRDSLRRRRAG